MNNNWIKWINTQLGASLDMLRVAIETATDEIWDHDDDDPPFWRVATHVVFYADFYYSTLQQGATNLTETYTLPNELSHYDDPWLHNLKEGVISKNELMTYFQHTMNNIRGYFLRGFESQLLDESGFDWLQMTKGELLLYNMRHIMEHTAILNQILKKHDLPASKWQGMVKI